MRTERNPTKITKPTKAKPARNPTMTEKNETYMKWAVALR